MDLRRGHGREEIAGAIGARVSSAVIPISRAAYPEVSPPATTALRMPVRARRSRSRRPRRRPIPRPPSLFSPCANSRSTAARRGSSGPQQVCRITLRPFFAAVSAFSSVRPHASPLPSACSSDTGSSATSAKPLALAHWIWHAVTGEQLPDITRIWSTGFADRRGGAGNRPCSCQNAVRAYSTPEEPTTKRGGVRADRSHSSLADGLQVALRQGVEQDYLCSCFEERLYTRGTRFRRGI